MKRLPSIFVSHGAPTFAVEPGRAGRLLAEFGSRLGKPRGVLVLSPHWMTRQLSLGLASRPRTIHDFGGFPAELYKLQSGAPGAPAIAREAAGLLEATGERVAFDTQRGLDHGIWVPLMHMFPKANVPVVPLSMPADLDPRRAWELGRALAPLAEKGVLVIGSGSLTHNLYEFRLENERGDAQYAREFVSWARRSLQEGDPAALFEYREIAPHAQRAHPTPDHYLPLPFAAGAAGDNAPLEILEGGMTYGMLSMESYVFGTTDMAEVPA